ncbi:hypothetical protein [Achromobacter arsenitoxydans]|uniref:Uncharacterized protein n=1 Tax=Achromobacter arsenitoxydans SY8 TaxID=477184 RepID=H0F8G1_9BURK|nr:hypothetical protein [Achromobacter arsenitoxydans]EHK65594.1 hypothetical protein KYC_15297 [Achromobacter arsenitoxydans SY8]
MEDFKYTVVPGSVRVLSSGERRAQRTLAAAEQLLHPERPAPESMSSVEAELASYVKKAYRPRVAW